IAEGKFEPDHDEAENGETDENTGQKAMNNPSSKLERFEAANDRPLYGLKLPDLRMICERWINKVSKYKMMYKEELEKDVLYLLELEAPTNRNRIGKHKARRIRKFIKHVERPNSEENRSCVHKSRPDQK
ncbi:20620_t:CDS:2, partial [Cetraspora pellucida]